MKKAKWQKFTELKIVFPSADQVILASGRTVIIFNNAGNNYRLVAAVHFNKQRIYPLRWMTHAECSGEEWKKTL
jgi:mRNA interferase HigB